MDRSFSEDREENQRSRNRDKSVDSQDHHQEKEQIPEKPKYDPTAFECIVKGLSFQAVEEDVIDFFSKFGAVKSVNIERRYNGSSKGSCFVKFETQEGLDEALKNTGVTFMGRQIWINKTKSKEERIKEYGGRIRYDNRGYGNQGYGYNRGYDRRGYGGYDRGYDRRGYGGYQGGYGGYNNYGGYNHGGRYGGYGGGYNNHGGYRDHQPITNSKIVFVGNLNFQTKKEDLWDYLDNVGKVIEVRIATNYNGRSKGFAHVEFETYEDADAALAINGKEFEGRPLRVNLAKPDRRRD